MHAREQFVPVVERLHETVRAVGPDAMARPTPCELFDVRALVGHLLGTSEALRRLGAGEAPDPADPWGNAGSAVTPTWQEDLCGSLSALAQTWQSPEAWEGSAFDGTIPCALLGQMAFGEVVLHGWDLARATGQDFDLELDHARTLHTILEDVGAAARAQGAFGRRVAVGAEAGPLHRALGASGRHPDWA